MVQLHIKNVDDLFVFENPLQASQHGSIGL